MPTDMPMKTDLLLITFCYVASVAIADPKAPSFNGPEPEMKEGNSKENLHYDHEVGWDDWREDLPERKANVFLDGKPIGAGGDARKILESQTWPAGTRVKVNLPPKPTDVVEFTRPYYSHTQFFQNWVKAGVELHFSTNGKKLDIHTLMFDNLKPDPQTEHYNWDRATWYFDSQKFDNGKSAVEAMKRVQWGKDSTILLLHPVNWNWPRGKFDDSQIESYKQRLLETGVQRVHVGDGPWHFLVYP